MMAVAGIFDATAFLIFFCAGRADNDVTLVAIVVMSLVTTSMCIVAS